MTKSNDDRRGLNIITLLAIFSSIGAIAAIVLSYTGQFTGLSGVFSDLLIFIATVLISYIITNNNERARFEREMQKLANFSRRRVDLTTANIEALSNELPEIDDLREMHRLVAFTLRNLAADSGASLKEIEEMGYVESDSEERSSQPQIAMPKRTVSLGEPGKTGARGDQGESQVTINCTNCGLQNATELGSAPGTTRVVECKNCGMDLNVHRVGDGSTRVVSRWANRASGVGRTTRPMELQLYGRHQKIEPVSKIDSCPRCGTAVSFQGKSNKVVDDRFCEGCQGNVEHNQLTGEVAMGPPYQIKFVDSFPIDRFECDCGSSFKPHVRQDDEGKKYFGCFSCHTLYWDRNTAKSQIAKSCPTPECNTSIVFKYDDVQKTGKQVCYNCRSRLGYDARNDTVEVIEVLEIPVVEKSVWVGNGQLCPHCEKPAGSNTIKNRNGEKFHMHWECKNPFQILG